MANLIETIEREQVPNATLPPVRSGDTVRVHVRIKEGDKERIQVFEGVIIKINRAGVRSTFTVRKVSYSVGVERIFPFFSPVVSKLEFVSRSHVRRSRLYYLRGLSGKAARLREMREATARAATETATWSEGQGG
ncbi:50S ribosomal protein L19 [Myxococcota bacterium]|nr:50S ribosomal protein L19 [Myxococcota bacterium]